jgi:serine/threonine protein kinase
VGPVFRGEDAETREPVVIKVIRVGLPPERVAVVAGALAALRGRLPSHPALTPLLDTGVVDVEPFIVTPFIDGDSLDVALREFGPANMADALPRLRTLADAMDTAAAAGVAHGSLHLRDIMVSVDDTVLTGMGIAAVLERVGVRPAVRRPYCAPEVALGHGISPAADQYALAAIAHEWLSGRRLAGGGAAGFQVPAVSAAGAEALHAVFARAMGDAPESRYPTATAFIEAIAALAGHAAPRSKTNRRPAMADAPRLSFDEPAEDVETEDDEVVAADDIVAADDAPPAGVVEAADPLDTPLIPTPSPAAMTWEPEVVVPEAPRPFATLDDDASDASDDVVDDVTPVGEPSWDTASADAEAAPPAQTEASSSESSASPWMTWAAVLLVATVAALAGGWALLRWGTPSSPATTASADSAEVSAPAVEPARETPPARETAAAPAPAALAPAPARVAEGAAPAVPAPAPAATPVAAPHTPPPAPRRGAPARPAARAAAAATTAGRLLVRSTPGGAEVFVNGERRGVTPLALRDLPFGAYAVRVVRAGFAPVEQRVAIDAGRPARSLELTLTRGAAATPAPAPAGTEAVAPGSLLVESRPAGARVLVDGAEIGVTPVTVPSLTAGPHTVRIERPGYVSITTTARIEARTRARVAVTLTAERPR